MKTANAAGSVAPDAAERRAVVQPPPALRSPGAVSEGAASAGVSAAASRDGS
jgi:hypothetical protein